MTIKVLTRDIAEKIAAGEVIERPASIVKELLDNAIDAQATRINVEIHCGGKEYIKVSDNGKGIPYEEMPVAFLRHATSKITSIEDLESLNTLGFRGEALPSIAAVSKVTLTSNTADQLAAGEIILEGGECKSVHETASREGTSVVVERLFYNLPARLKFLKSDAHEASLISELLTEYSLGKPSIAFEFYSQGKRILRTSGKGDIKETIAEVWGKNIATSLIQNANDESDVKVKGFFSPINLSRSNRRYQIFFVNGRLVKNPLLHSALEHSYRGVLPPKKYPVALIYIEIPQAQLDVNVHPAKTLIKFHDERLVFNSIRKTVNEALMTANKIHITETASTMSEPTQSYPAFTQQKLSNFEYVPKNSANSSYKNFEATLPYLSKEKEPEQARLFPRLKLIGVYKNSYIVTQGIDGLYLVDQHAAHERVLYEEILHKLENQQSYSQGLLEPIVVEVPLSLTVLSDEIIAQLNKMGFDITFFGSNSFLVRSIPSMLKSAALSDSILEMINSIAEHKDKDTRKLLAEKLACKAAVKLCDPLTLVEAEKLLADLSACEEPFRCPHGRPIIVEIGDSLIEKWFKRILS